MNVAWRTAAIVADPAGEWTRIEKEAGDPVYLMTRYVALLALIPAVFGFVGACVIGVVVPGGGVVRTTLFDGFFGAVFGYLETLVLVCLLGALVHVLAPLFGGKRAFAKALELVAYSLTPLWLSGIFLLLPGLHFLRLTGLYGVYIFVAGLPLLFQSPPRKAAGFAALIVIFAGALMLAAGTAQETVFPGSSGI